MRRIFLVASALLIMAAPAIPRAGEAPPASPELDALVKRACVGCHALEVVTGQGHDPKAWAEIVDRMADRGLDASEEDLARIKAYLAKTLPPPETAAAPAG